MNRIFKISLRLSWRAAAAAAVFVLMLVVATSVSAQNGGGWNIAQRGGAGDLVAVFFTSAEKGWIGGDEGYLATTADGGINWKRQLLNTKDNVNEIYFRNEDSGYVLAGRRIYLSKDGGKIWRENVVVNPRDYRNLTPEFLSIRFADKKRGWIVGSVSNQRDEVVDSLILQTVDGGESWTRVPISFRQELYHIDFVNDEKGWIVGDKGLILMTDDGGKTWMRQAINTEASLFNVDFRDSKDGFIVGGGGTILRTEDGGRNWERVSSPISKSLNRVFFTDDKNGWIVGAGGTILRTGDRGKTWVKQDTRTTDSLYGLYMEKKNGWAVGKKGLVLRYAR